MEALEELYPEQHEGRVSYVIGGIYTLPVKNRGAPQKVAASVGPGAAGRIALFSLETLQPIGRQQWKPGSSHLLICIIKKEKVPNSRNSRK